MARKKATKTNIGLDNLVRWQHAKTGVWQYGTVRKTYDNSALVELDGVVEGDYTVVRFTRLELIDKAPIVVEQTETMHPYTQSFPHNADKIAFNERQRKVARKG
ncbi:hypothetical protein [Metasolibacillus meyeri]|uniref:hypothetical protein n=1 Tax=Metasolibacillus meyeri TaxID=1071052 RepID=UPI000D306549|nr:hypothetical protein [Metasolibacillus meyeri]